MTGAKRLIALHMHKCVPRRKLRRPLEFQKMSNLPPERLEPGPSFSNVETLEHHDQKNQCPYLLKFVDLVLDVEVTTDLIIKLRICRMVFTKPLVDIHVNYELLSLR